MSDLRFVGVRAGSQGGGIELLSATPKGSIRVTPIDVDDALALIADLARYIRAHQSLRFGVTND